MAASYSLIVFCALQIRAFLGARASSRQTRKLNADMSKVLLLSALQPLSTNGAPTLYMLLSITLCSSHPTLDTCSSLVVFMALFINPISTIWFIRPYRRQVLKWFRLEKHILPMLNRDDSSVSTAPPNRNLPRWLSKLNEKAHSFTAAHDT